MKFDYLVKHNGIYYPAGSDVPVEETRGGQKPTPVTSGKVDKEDAQASSSEEQHPRKFSEEDLKLPYMKLKALAKKEGLKVESNAKAEEIKNMLRAL